MWDARWFFNISPRKFRGRRSLTGLLPLFYIDFSALSRKKVIYPQRNIRVHLQPINPSAPHYDHGAGHPTAMPPTASWIVYP